MLRDAGGAIMKRARPFAVLVLGAVAGGAGCGAAPPPPPPPADVELWVRFTTLEVIDDKEAGSGDWRVTMLVDGRPLPKPILGEADAGGAVPLDATVVSRGPESSHRLVVTTKVEEYDGGFDDTWEFIGEKTLTFDAQHGFGVGGQTVEFDTDEGHVKLRLVITRNATVER